MKNYYNNKHILITGGSSGIGLTLAKIVAKEGAQVTILARRVEVLEKARLEIEAVGGQPVKTLQADIANREQVVSVLNQYIERCGTPDILVNCAGNTYPGMFEDQPLEIFEELMNANYQGTVTVTKTVLPGMIKRQSGAICIVSSLAGLVGAIGYSAYGATKFALRGLADVLYQELRHHNIKMSIAFPADTMTPQLDFDNLHKPAITRELTGSNSNTYTAEFVAMAIARGIASGKYIITPGSDSTLFYNLSNTFGLVYPVMTFLVNRAWKKIGGPKNNGTEQHKT